MLETKEPQFNFTWIKQGVPGINTLSNSNCLLIIREENVKKNEEFAQYFTLNEVKREDYTEENYNMILDVFKYPVNSLWILKLNLVEVDGVFTPEKLDEDKFILIENENIDYGVYPEADEIEIASIVTTVRDLRKKLHPIKWILEGKINNDYNETFFIQFTAEELLDESGKSISVKTLLPSVMAQRASCPFTQSLTYKPVAKVSSAKRLKNVEEILGNGIMTIIKVNKRWVYARDINSLTTLGDLYDERFIQNQRIVVMDSVVKDIKNSWQTYWVGNYQNSAKNKNAFSAACNVYISSRISDINDPIENGFFELDLEEHKNILIKAGKDQEYIRSLNLAQLESVDTGTNVYIKGKVQINGVMEDISFVITAAVDFE